jgi:hypothetical protein
MASCRLPCLAVTLLSLVSGCSATSSGELSLSPIVAESARKADSSTSSQAHDFGTVISEDQTLRHEFTIRNPSDRAIRLIRGRALTPCCSSIGPLPESIPPNGDAKILAVLRPGYQSGPKGVAFLIETESANQRQIGLALHAQLVSAWEAERLEGSATVVPVGQPGMLTFRVIARRKGSSGRGLPEKISASAPIEAIFAGPCTSRTGPDRSIEATRDVVVSLPATDQPGIKRGELAFVWPDGRIETIPLSWEVRPRLKLIPAGLVLARSSQPVERTIVIESDGRPFRVVGVASMLLAEPVNLPEGLATRNTIHIKLNLSQKPFGRTMSVTIATDHPDQSSIDLTVLFLPNAEVSGG